MIAIIPNWHPKFVHFTVAILTVALLLIFASAIFTKLKWHDHVLIVAHWNFWIGTVVAIVTAIAGWFAYNMIARDTPSHAAMTVLRNWSFITLGVLILATIWLAWSKRDFQQVSKTFVESLVTTLGLLGTTAWYGGYLVYRNGLGVMSMPMMNEDAVGHNDHTQDRGEEKCLLLRI